MELPTDMITEILCRSPASTLYKNFKRSSVLCNKELHNIISDPKFPILFQAYDNIKPCSFLAYDQDKTFLIEYDPNNNDFMSTQLNMDFVENIGRNFVSSPPLVLASCNGWLLVRTLYDKIDCRGVCYLSAESLRLVNPITHRYVTIVPFRSSRSLPFCRYTIGYIQKTGKYKVVRFSNGHYDILTVDDTSNLHWRRTTSSNNLLYDEFNQKILDHSQDLVVVKGSLYCLVEQHTKILKFDFDREEFSLISTPYSTRNPGYFGGSLGVVGESLYMGTSTWSDGFVIWVTNGESCWTKLTKIHEFKLSDSFEVIRVFNNGNILMLTHKDKKLHMYNVKEKQNEEMTMKIQGLDERTIQLMGVLKVVPSLLSLNHTHSKQ